MSKYFYALSDGFTGDNPIDYCSGFANTKEVIAFTSCKNREDWLNSTKLLTAKKLSRKQAESFTSWKPAEYYSFKKCEKVKPVRLYHNGDYVILRCSAN